jgi:hypothetical protein
VCGIMIIPISKRFFSHQKLVSSMMEEQTDIDK